MNIILPKYLKGVSIVIQNRMAYPQYADLLKILERKKALTLLKPKLT